MSLFTKLFGLGDSDHYNKGIEYYNRGEYDKAVVEFETAIASNTNKSDPYYQLGMFYAAETHAHLGFSFYKTGDLERAEEQFKKAVEENARYPDLHYHLGVISEKRGQHEQAIGSLEKAIEINPEYMEAYCYLAIALSEIGRRDEAMKAFEKATRFGLAVPIPEPPRLAEVSERFLRPPYDELKDAMSTKEDFRTLVNEAVTAHNVGESEKAINQLRDAVALRPQYPDLRCRLAIMEGEVGRFDEAIAELDKALDTNPNYVDALFYRGVYALKLAKYRDACESLKRAVDLRPDYWDLRCYLGIAFFKRGMFDESRAELLQVTKECPKYSLAHYYLGMTSLSSRKMEEATEAFKVAFDDPRFRTDMPGESADILLESGDYDAAIERYTVAISENPDYADLHCGLGVAFMARSRFEDAERELERALEINQEYAEAHACLGRVKALLDKEEGAIEHLEKALSLRPGYADLHRELADRYIANERHSEAIAELEKAVAINARSSRTGPRATGSSERCGCDPGTERDMSHRETSPLPNETWLRGSPDSLGTGPERLSVVLCYPATYPLGMSNLGFQAALAAFRGIPGVRCERAFWDPTDARRGRSLESGTPLSAFDVVAFSVSFEGDFLVVPALLAAGGIPVASADRSVDDPLVVLGGICSILNPEPVAAFVDAVLVGAAEGLVPPFVDELARGGRKEKEETLGSLARLPGVYVPSLYRVDRRPDGRIAGFASEDDAPLPVVPAQAPSGSGAPQSLVLSEDTHFGRAFLIEVYRGCGRGCRFCAAGHVYRPLCARPVEEILDAVREALPHTKKVGLVTAALGDHPDVRELLDSLARLGAEVTIASMRAENVDSELARLLVASGVRSVTIAPETGTEPLRKIIGKPTADGAIVEAARALRGAGLERLKLYFMVGLPGERADDVEAIPGLVREVRSAFVAGRAGARLSASVAGFVPKARTPFQWVAMEEEKVLRAKLAALRRGIAGGSGTGFTSAGPREAWREAVLSRGGRDIAPAIARFALEGLPWKASLKRSGVDAVAVAGLERAPDEVFPWEIVEAGVPKEKLLASYRAARSLITDRDDAGGSTREK